MKFGKFEIGWFELMAVIGLLYFAIDRIAPLVLACK